MKPLSFWPNKMSGYMYWLTKENKHGVCQLYYKCKYLYKHVNKLLFGFQTDNLTTAASFCETRLKEFFSESSDCKAPTKLFLMSLKYVILCWYKFDGF